ncbi:MAG: sulfotransferase [Leptospirales bacterium]
MKIGHIINPVIVNTDSDLYDAQPVTFESLHRAKLFCEVIQIPVHITLIAATYQEDASIVPDYFDKKLILEKSVLDINQFHVPRKLPLISELINKANETGEYDYLIYTHVDISVQPYYYEYIYNKIESGNDGLVINRRTISKLKDNNGLLTNMYSEIGEKHPGYDCFVMNCKNIPFMEWENVCIGANWVGRILLANTTGFSKKHEITTEAHVTFHLGDDRAWKNNKFKDYDTHNAKEVIQAIDKLQAKKKFTYIELISQYHAQLQGKPVIKAGAPVRITDPGDHLNLTEDPVFIVGYPRSGTTLVQAYLHSTTGLVSFPETHFFNIVWNKCLPDLETKLTEKHVMDALVVLKEVAGFDITGKLQKNILTLTQQSSITQKTLFEQIVRGLISYYYPGLSGNVRYIEKTPSHARVARRIKNTFKNAKFIWIIRWPIDTILSAKKHLIPQGSMSLREIARDWMNLNTTMTKFAKNCPKDIFKIRFKAFTSNPGKYGKQTATFLNIPFNKEVNSNSKKVNDKLVHSWETWKQSDYTKVNKTKNKYFFKGSIKEILSVYKVLYGKKRAIQVFYKFFN